MHPLVKSVEYAVRGALPIRAEALSQVNELKKKRQGIISRVRKLNSIW
jgi:hypothetical protein